MIMIEKRVLAWLLARYTRLRTAVAIRDTYGFALDLAPSIALGLSKSRSEATVHYTTA